MSAESPETRAPYAAFLESDSVVLQTKSSKRSFRIHETLLALKARAIHVAFERNFKEKKESRIVFQETADDTVVRFLEWAYRGDYSVEIYFENPVGASKWSRMTDTAAKQEETAPAVDEVTVVEEVVAEEAMPEEPEGSDELPLAERKVKEDLIEINHPLSCHTLVYIFAEVWGILPLKSLAFGKLTNEIAKIQKPENLSAQLAVIDLLETAFTKLPPSDSLLDWLGQYAAWAVSQLRLQERFEDLMEFVGPAMLPYVNSASYAPWESGPSSLVLPRKKGKR